MKTVYFFGYGGSTKVLGPLKPIINELGLKLVTIHEWPDADIKWELNTWLIELKKADIIIIPANYKIQPCKSNTRLTQALSLGKPVICSPLDAYIRVYNETPGCCLIADSIEEWKECLIKLRDDDNFCKQLAIKALIAAQNYSIEKISKKWIDVLLSNENEIDIIITIYNNVEYLTMCLDSIKKNTYSAYRVIISDAGSNSATWEYYKTLTNVKIFGKQGKRLCFSQTCNIGIKNSTSKYFVLLNSDVIVSKNWDLALLKKMEADPNLGICGVLSNCDRFWLHDVSGKPKYSMSIPGLELVPGMKASQLEGKIDDLYSFMDSSNKSHVGTLVYQEWVAFYAVMFNRKVVNVVGLLDPGFVNGCEDLDFCIRTKKMGYKIAQAIDCFVYHFGGISRGSYEKEGSEHYHREDRENKMYFNEKYGANN